MVEGGWVAGARREEEREERSERSDGGDGVGPMKKAC